MGYLIGISRVDPLHWNLTLERFLPEDMTTLPDIDLDFPRALRDALIAPLDFQFDQTADGRVLKLLNIVDGRSLDPVRSAACRSARHSAGR